MTPHRLQAQLAAIQELTGFQMTPEFQAKFAAPETPEQRRQALSGAPGTPQSTHASRGPNPQIEKLKVPPQIENGRNESYY